MGSVWVAQRAGMPRPVAVKFLATRPDRAALVRFQREASAASRIDSPNVVSILEHGATDDGTPYIVMEFLEGETLGERLARLGRLPLDDTAAIVRQVAYAVDATADDFPLVKVLDFGMAKQTQGAESDELTGTGVAVGTPEYMSPEQLLGSKEVDGQSDVWALGVVAYRALAGVSPFEGDSPHALFFSICRGAYRPLADVGIPAVFEDWFRLALSPKKPTRFPSARAMVDAFDRVVAELEATQRLQSSSLANDEDGSTAFFDVSRASTRSGDASSAAPPTSTTNPVWGRAEESIITAKNMRGAELEEAIARVDAEAHAIGSTSIDALIAESVRHVGESVPRYEAHVSGLFERTSRRLAEAPIVVDDLASLEEPSGLRPQAPSEDLIRTVPERENTGFEALFAAMETSDGASTVLLDDIDSQAAPSFAGAPSSATPHCAPEPAFSGVTSVPQAVPSARASSASLAPSVEPQAALVAKASLSSVAKASQKGRVLALVVVIVLIAVLSTVLFRMLR